MDYSAIAANLVARTHESDPFLGGYGVRLDYSLASLRAIDEFISDMFGTRGESPDSDDYTPSRGKMNLIIEFGSYLGETVRCAAGGSWCEEPGHPNEPLWMRLHLDANEIMYPIARVFKRFKNGEEDALWVLAWSVMRERRPETIPLAGQACLRQAEHFLAKSHLPEARRLHLAAEFYDLAGGYDPALKDETERKAAELRSRIDQAELEAYLAARDEDDRPEPPPFANEATAVVREAARYDFHLDFTPASLAALDLWIAEVWDDPEGRFRKLGAADWQEQEWLIGCYVGEVLVRGCGGAWHPDHKEKRRSTIALAGGLAIDPFARVAERSRSGMGVPLYGCLAGLRAEAEAAADADWFVAQADKLNEKYNRNARAAVYLDHALTLAPDRAELLLRKGQLLLTLRRFEAALAGFDGVLAGDHANAEAWEGRGAALLGMGCPVEAREAYDRAMKLAPARASLHCRLGDMLRQEDKHDEALAAYDRAITLDAECLPALFARGELLAMRLEDKAAIEAFEAVRLNRTRAALKWHHLGLCVDKRAHLHPEARENAYQDGQVCSAEYLVYY